MSGYMQMLSKILSGLFILILVLGSCSRQSERTSDHRMNRISISDAVLSGSPQSPADSSASLEKWLDRELLYREALQNHLDKDEAIRDLVSGYEKDVLASSFLDYYLSNRIIISEEEIVNYYRENRDGFRLNGDRARIVHYLFDNSDDANSSKRILLYGDQTQKNSLTERFLPEERSVSEGMLIDVLDEAIFVQGKQAQIIGPLHTEFGYHIIDVKEYFPKNSFLPVAEVRQLIRERIAHSKKQNAYTELIRNLKEKYDIQ